MNSQAARALRRRPFRNGVAGTSMPPWGNVSEGRPGQRRARLRLHDLHQRAGATSSSRTRCRTRIRWPTSAESIARGEQIFLQRCTGCHGRKADGKGPNSLDILPHPRNLRNSCVRRQRRRPPPVRFHPLRRAGHRHAVLDRLRPHPERRRRHCQLHSQHRIRRHPGASSMPDN